MYFLLEIGIDATLVASIIFLSFYIYKLHLFVDILEKKITIIELELIARNKEIQDINSFLKVTKDTLRNLKFYLNKNLDNKINLLKTDIKKSKYHTNVSNTDSEKKIKK